jgi:hypothetical protein
MIPEVGWMFDDELPEEIVDSLVRMDPLQWALMSFHLAQPSDVAH